MKLKNRQNHDIRNFGFGSRCPRKAVHNACRLHYQSYASAHHVASRFFRFISWKASIAESLKDLRDIDKKSVDSYCQFIEGRVKSECTAVSTAHNYVSAINTVMHILRGDRKIWVSTRFDTSVPNRSNITTLNKGAKIDVSSTPPRDLLDCLLRLQYLWGLRFEESCKLNARTALEQVRAVGSIVVSRGTKGGRSRQVPVADKTQEEILAHATHFQGPNYSMIPADLSYAKFRDYAYSGSSQRRHNFHAYRHGYAHRRYRQIVGADCPVLAKVKHGLAHIQYLSKELNISIVAAKKIDTNARLIISRELGHERTQITNAYLG
mgnify:FL=1